MKLEAHWRLIEDQGRANEDQKWLQELQRQKELEEEWKIAEFAKQKEQLEKLRRDKEDQKFREKQAERQRLIDRQIE